jgi:hypothetical protein
MRWWSELKYIMRKLNRRQAEREAEEEIQTHLELEAREQIEAGLSPEESRYAARRVFGSVALAKEAILSKRYITALVPDLPSMQAAPLMFGIFVTIAVALIAVALPAYRASRVEPMTALRYE